MITRTEYMSRYTNDANGSAIHREYFSQLVNERTIRFVVQAIGADRIKNSTDPHMNDIPLAMWDRLCPSMPVACDIRSLGDSWTLGNAVCVAKEAARQFKERQQ